MTEDPSGVYVGRLLVATPRLDDPNFSRSVILLLEHGPEGALGVILNRPSELTVADPLPEWASVATDPAVVFMGGPVSPGSVLALGRAGDVPGEVAGPVALDLDGDPAGVPTLDGVRIFAGYAGWAPHQLEAEIIAGGWYVVDADPTDAFSPDPSNLWWEVLGRQEGPLSRLANFPLDPTLN